MTILRDQLQQAINNLDGDVGSNHANTALNELMTSYEQGLSLSLNKTENVREFVGDLDATIAEMLTFRNQLVTAINSDASEISESKVAGVETSQWEALKRTALVSLNDNDEQATINIDEALAEAREDDELLLFECEVGLFDHNEDPTTAYDTVSVLVASENTRAAATNAVSVADECITNQQGSLSGVSLELMSEPDLVEPSDYTEQQQS